jgi:hypothetical protein
MTGPSTLEVDVHHRPSRAGPAYQMTIADVHPTREAMQAVGHQDLPVVAQIDVAAPVQRKEAADLSRRPLQEAPRGGSRVLLAEAID